MNRKQRRAGKGRSPPPGAAPDKAAAARVRALYGEAVRRHQAGQWADAERLYRQVLHMDAGHADALHALGVLARQAGRPDLAIGLIGKAIALNARRPDFHGNLAIALQGQGRLAEAAGAYRRAIELKPDYAEAHGNLGLALQAQGTVPAAVAAYRRALCLLPDFAMAHYNLGNARAVLDQAAAAAAAYRRALACRPDYAEASTNLGNILQAQRQLTAAAACYRRAVALQPAFVETHNNLGAVLLGLGRVAEAVVMGRRALTLRADFPEASCNLGNALKERGDLAEAARAYATALSARPLYAEAHGNHANVLQAQGQLAAAVTGYRRALAVRPDYAEACGNLGNTHAELGEVAEAVTCYRRALVLRPDCAPVHSSLIMTLHAMSDASAADILAVARTFVYPPSQATVVPRRRGAGRESRPRLRIGYVSAGFRQHVCGSFIGPVLAAHDRALIETYCYSNALCADAVTAALQATADHWRPIAGMPDSAVAALIERDGIDILVDLDGHTGGNRLSLFAVKPAPVQVSWFGAVGTIGLPTIDYVLADRYTVPDGDDAQFAETVWRLPDLFFCYRPPAVAITPGPPPHPDNGFVTFGSFNRRAKLSDETIAAWATILRRVERSRLYLKTRSLADAGCRATLTARFEERGIAAERLILEAEGPLRDALEAYNRVDIALDPFPFGGGATTADCLWMGVPLVSLNGTRWVGRIGAGILAVVGLSPWVATDVAHYVEIAVDLANGGSSLPRAELRRRFESSSFCDVKRLTASVEAAYRAMWDRWCD